MKRLVFVILVFSSLFAFFAFSASASGAEDYLEQLYGTLGTSEELTDEIGIETIISEALSAISGSGGEILAFSAFLLGAVIMISLASAACEQRQVVSAVTALSVIGVYGTIYKLVSVSVSALNRMSEIFFALIPIATGVTLAGGGVQSAGAEATAMGALFGAVSGVFVPLLLPLVSLMFALCACAALGGTEVRALFLRVRSTFLWLLGIVSAILMGGIALQSVISAAKDSASMRIAKYSASGLLPVIGSTVSASLSSLASGLSYAKSVIGVQSIYVLLTVALSPLVLILAYRMILSFFGGLLSFLGSAEGAGGLSYLCFSLDALLSVYGVSMLLYIFELVMFMKSGVAIL